MIFPLPPKTATRMSRFYLDEVDDNDDDDDDDISTDT